MKSFNNNIGGQVHAPHDCNQAAACQHYESLEISAFIYRMCHSVLVSAERRAISRHPNWLITFLSQA